MVGVHQGDIFFANLNPTKGKEQAGYRPVLVLQNDKLNPILNTVIVIPITSNLKAKGKLITFALDKKSSGLPKESVALIFQIRTIDKTRLKQRVARISQHDLLEIKRRLTYAI